MLSFGGIIVGCETKWDCAGKPVRLCVATMVAAGARLRWGWCVHPLVSLRAVWVCVSCVSWHTLTVLFVR